MPVPKPGEAPLYTGMIDCFAKGIKAEGPLVREGPPPQLGFPAWGRQIYLPSSHFATACGLTHQRRNLGQVLYRGFTPAFLKLAPYTCISFILTEKIMVMATGAAAF